MAGLVHVACAGKRVRVMVWICWVRWWPPRPSPCGGEQEEYPEQIRPLQNIPEGRHVLVHCLSFALSMGTGPEGSAGFFVRESAYPFVPPGCACFPTVHAGLTSLKK